MIYAYDKTGKITGMVMDGSVEQANFWASQGLTLIEGPERDINLWKIIGGDWTAKTPEEIDAEKAASEAAAAAQAKILEGTLGVLDLINLLLTKGILTKEDLPEATAAAISTAANVIKVKEG